MICGAPNFNFKCTPDLCSEGRMMASPVLSASLISLQSLSSSACISNAVKFHNGEHPGKGSSSTTPLPIVSMASDNKKIGATTSSRRQLTLGVLMGTLIAVNNGIEPDNAVAASKRTNKSDKIPLSEFKSLPNGLKYYDIKVGSGATAVRGSRVAIHYVAKWKGVTFMTSRQGMGVTGGSPYGFDIGASESGIVLKGLDLGVEGMKVGGQRVLLLPPELAYGDRGVQEIPPGATLEFNVELLSIKTTPFGFGVKLVEG